VTLGIANRNFEREFNSGLVTNTVLNNKYLGQTFNSERLADVFTSDMVFKANYAGAPIVNLQGRLVGMVANDRNEIMIGENLQTALTSYLSSGKITRPKLGMQYFSLSALQANLRKLTRAGVMVVSVDKGSSAAEAGLVANDLIYEYNGTSLENLSFEQLLNQTGPTASVKLKLLRSGKDMELTLILKPTQ
jgi:S1-C subfamily serine protease